MLQVRGRLHDHSEDQERLRREGGGSILQQKLSRGRAEGRSRPFLVCSRGEDLPFLQLSVEAQKRDHPAAPSDGVPTCYMLNGLSLCMYNEVGCSPIRDKKKCKTVK